MKSPCGAMHNVYIKGLFEIHLFCWNWKFFVENIVDKSKS